jgi:hypothetical protein
MTNIEITPGYRSAVNSVTEPDKFVACSRYLVEKWLPDLGPNGFAILCFLRRECFYNRKTGELRNEVNKVTMPGIAKGCKLSVSTVRRELQENKFLGKFVSVRRDYVPDGNRGGVRKDKNSYTVLMDDLVHPSDDALLQERIYEAVSLLEKGGMPPKERAQQQAKLAMRQNDTSHTPGSVKVTHTGSTLTPPCVRINATMLQNDASLIDYSSILKNTLRDLEKIPPSAEARSSDKIFSSSLSQSSVKVKKEPEQEQAAPEWVAREVTRAVLDPSSGFGKEYAMKKAKKAAKAGTAQ